ncbi:MAG: hypothetical protein FWE37_01130 [Spirochaetaceae bacterium]|nr:hypothetical protein [Spirochaetaceae bacterium]
MTKVKNLRGTGGSSTNWKEYWEKATGRKFGDCSREGCNEKATDGAHVKKVGETNKPYIVPLCHTCNLDYESEFNVRDADLVPVN